MAKFEQPLKFNLEIAGEREYLLDIFKKIFDLKEIKELVIKQIKLDERSSVYKYEFEFLDSKNNLQKKVNYGTVRADLQQHQRVFRLLQCIKESELKSRIPEPLFFDVKNSFHLEGALSGVRLLDALNVKNYRERYEELIAKTARWLAEFHKLDFKKIPFPYGWKEEEKELREVMEGQKNWLKKILPRYSAQAELLLGEIFEWRKRLYSEKNLSFAHNDFNSGNVMVMPNFEIGVLDFSDAGIFDPMCDVASFILRLRMNAIKFPPGYKKFDFNLEESERFSGVFIKYYFESKGEEFRGNVATRFLVWQAHFALRMLAMFAVEAAKIGGVPKLLKDVQIWLEKAKSS